MQQNMKTFSFNLSLLLPHLLNKIIKKINVSFGGQQLKYTHCQCKYIMFFFSNGTEHGI